MSPKATMEKVPGLSGQVKLAWAALFLSLIIQVWLSVGFAQNSTMTIDEGIHLAAGYRALQCADYGINPEHPPLAKALAAFPIRGWELSGYVRPCGSGATSKIEGYYTGRELLNQPMGRTMLMRARYSIFVLSVALLVVTFLSAWEMFGPIAASAAALLTAMEPTLRAHGILITTDNALTLALVLVVWLTWRYVQKQSWPRAVGIGLALGFGFVVKHSAVLLPFIVAVLIISAHLLDKERNTGRWLRTLAAWGLACVLGVSILWASYGFRYSALPSASETPDYKISTIFRESGQEGKLSGRVLQFVQDWRLLPESYLAGLADIFTTDSRPAFLFRPLKTGVWYYFPVAFAIKTSLALLILSLTAIAVGLVSRKRESAFLLLFTAFGIFLGVAMTSKINIGVRHVLPLYPLMILLASGFLASYLHKNTFTRFAFPGLLLFQFASAVWSHPFELAYSNELFGGVNGTHRYLSDSNVSWGQEGFSVARWARSRNLTPDNCLYINSVQETAERIELPCAKFDFGVTADIMAPVPRTFQGTVIVGALYFQGTEENPFLRKQPDAVIGGASLAFTGSHDLSAFARDSRMHRASWMLMAGKPEWAYEELKLVPPELRGHTGWVFLAAQSAEYSGRYAEARLWILKFLEMTQGDASEGNARRILQDRLAKLPQSP